MKRWLLIGFVCLYVLNAYSNFFPSRTTYRVCFTPGGDCTTNMTHAIDKAKQFINVQAYSFTSRPIIRALTKAAYKGVQVNIILDQSQFHCPNYSHINRLLDAGALIWKAQLVTHHKSKIINGIAHNKVMIIDGKIIITGSFNFTYSAQHYNAENSLIIQSKTLAQQYLTNWLQRKEIAKQIFNFTCYRHN